MNKVLTKKNIIPILIIFIISLPSIFPLFHPGFFKTDDGDWMIIRFSAFHQALRDGQFPVRFLPRINFDYGYPVANFLYPGFMYLAEPIHLIGFGFVTTIKIVLGLSMLLSGICTYLWLRKMFDTHAAAIGSFLYLYAPYHLYDIYVRGSVGEILALAIVPFVLWQIERRSFVLTTIGLALLILSHNTLAVLFYPILFLYGLIRIEELKRNKEALIFLLMQFLLGIGIASFFFLPALFDLHFTVFSKTPVSAWQVYFAFPQTQLLGLIIATIIIIFAVFFRKMLAFIRKQAMHVQRIWYLFAFVLVVGLFLNLPVSGIFWSILPISFIQFPFRLLSLEILSVAYLVPFFLTKLHTKQQYLFGTVLFVILMIPGSFFLRPLTFTDKGDGFYATNEDTTTVKKEYMPIWVPKAPDTHPEQKVLLPDGEITQRIIRSNTYIISAKTSFDTKLTINTIYFPGWYAHIDGKEVPVDTTYGLLQIPFPKGEHTVHITWQETPIRFFSDMVSVVSFILLIVGFRYYKKIV